MKTVQKLEIGAGLATFVSTLAYFCVYMLPYSRFVYENDGALSGFAVLLTTFANLVIPGVVTAFGAYFWAVKSNWFGFGAVVFGASMTAFVDLVIVCGVRFYSPDRVTTLLILMPLIFPISTVVFAFWFRKVLRSPR